jgi:peptide/nickel transport system permease protein
VLRFIVRRILLLVPILVVLSIVVFVLIQLPPGDVVDTIIAQMIEQGVEVNATDRVNLEIMYGLDRPIAVQYFVWVKNIVLHFNFGRSFIWNRPVTEVVGDSLLWTFIIAIITLTVSWVAAFFVGIYSARHQYSFLDYSFTFMGFIGIAVPGFLLALVLMWLGYSKFGIKMGGLFSVEYIRAAWSWRKFVDLLKHLWVPVVVLGAAGTANLIRIMRANLLDELQKPYVITARAKGLPENRLVWKYPVRVALNPFVSALSYLLPQVISGGSIVAVVLGLPTVGPLLISSLVNQDMYLAGSILMMLSIFTVVSTLISDLLLAVIDPRIRLN